MLGAQMRELAVGDRVKAPPEDVRRPNKRGKIVEVASEPGRERCRVRWDDGDETFVYPGTAIAPERPGVEDDALTT